MTAITKEAMEFYTGIKKAEGMVYVTFIFEYKDYPGTYGLTSNGGEEINSRYYKIIGSIEEFEKALEMQSKIEKEATVSEYDPALNVFKRSLEVQNKKTVADAYGYYRGRFPDVSRELFQTDEIVSPCLNGSIDTSKVDEFEVRCIGDNGAHSIKGDDWQIICTREEFEAYAKEQNDKYDKNTSAIATLEGLGYEHKGGELWKPPIGGELKQNDKPVFTQEMADNGGFPPVGSEVVLEGIPAHHRNFQDAVGRQVVVLGYHRGRILTHWNGRYDSFEPSCFGPIDTRTDKEKLIDEMKLRTKEYNETSDLNENISIHEYMLDHFDIKPR